MTQQKRKTVGSGVVINIAIIALGLVGIAILLVSQALDGESEASGPIALDFDALLREKPPASAGSLKQLVGSN